MFHKKFQDTKTAIPTILNGLETVEIVSFEEAVRPKITIQTVPVKPTVRLKPAGSDKLTVSV